MKIRTLTILALLAGFLFASCSDDKGNGATEETGEEQTIFLKINTGMLSGTRSDETTATGTTATLYTALVYFLDGAADPIIHEVLTVGPNGQDLTIANLEDGYRVEGISSTVTQVYVIGNYNSTDSQGDYPDFPMQDGQTLSDIQAVLLNIEQVSHGSLAGGITEGNLITVMDGRANVTRYGDDPTGWNGDATLTADDIYANISISPIVSRIEIQEIEYTGEFTSFTLEGIYINYYYPEMPINLDRTGLTFINNGSDVAKYDVTLSNPDFAYRYYMTLYDIINDARVVDPSGVETYAPETTPNGVWAYQVFGNSNPVPHIIVKLTGITNGDGVYIGNRYLTVTGFEYQGSPVTTLERNVIYKIPSLAFTDGDLGLTPEPETISIWVHVEIEPWVTRIVSPVI